MPELELERGQEVNISYTGYSVRAVVLEPPDSHNWVLVEQISEYEDEPIGHRPRYSVGLEYVSLPGEPLKTGPFSHRASGA